MVQQNSQRSYVLAMLAVMLAFNYVDRLALGVMLQTIKVDLSLTDSQLGLLTGIAFALFYAIVGIPIARWADRGDRVRIISVTAALGSAAVALCGTAMTFMQLLWMRVVVAVGESGLHAPALSLLADHFSRAERPRAVARYMLGGPLALTIGYFVAGWLAQFYGWRTTFVLLGVPGVIVAVIAGYTLQEPRRRAMSDPVVVPSPQTPAALEPSAREVFIRLWGSAGFRHLFLCFSVWWFFGYGILQWQPAFLVRSHGLETGVLGTWLSLVYGAGGLLGTYVGGEMATRYAANNERLQLRWIGGLFILFAALTAAAYLVRDFGLAISLLAISAIGGAAINGPLFAATQTVVPANMRATSIALMFLSGNLVGAGLGPLAVGALSDALRPVVGEESLRYALLACCPGYFWIAFHAWRAGRAFAKVEDSGPANDDGAVKIGAQSS